MTIKISQPKMLEEIVNGIVQAEGAASIIIHSHQDPRWLLIRDTLSGAKDLCFHAATFQARKVLIQGS